MSKRVVTSKCPNCIDGYVNGEWVECGRCDGQGYITAWGEDHICSRCDGEKGHYEKVTCSVCNGSGELKEVVEEEETEVDSDPHPGQTYYKDIGWRDAGGADQDQSTY